MDNCPIAARSLERPYHIDGDQLERQYKEHLSGYSEWDQKEHAEQWLVFPDNIGERLSIDETSLSNGELYTIVTNKAAKGRNGSIVAIVSGTESDSVLEALRRIPMKYRQQVMEITLDMAGSMGRISRQAFPNAVKVIDRFHVQKLALNAVQELRIKFRWDAMDRENEDIRQAKLSGKEYKLALLPNGDTLKQLLFRSRYLLFKSPEKWTKSQKIRAKLLFDIYPDIAQAYSLSHKLRLIYSKTKVKGVAYTKLARWFNDVQKSGIDTFRTIEETIYNHYENILNFFDNRSTNASAESFNAKIKAFRRQIRGVVDVKYFLFRLCKIYA